MSDLKVLLKDITNLSCSLYQKFYLLGIEIENNFLQIKLCNSIDEAAQYFDCLQETQEVLATLVFKENIKVPDFLWVFIKEFDRLDDQDLRKYIYREVKEGRNLFKRH